MTAAINFIPYNGDLHGLYSDKNHLVFRWNKPDVRLLFSVARRGDACCCHFCSDKNGLRFVKQAIGEFESFLYWLFPWCKMIIAAIDKKKPSVERIVKKLGFYYFGADEKLNIWCKYERCS